MESKDVIVEGVVVNPATREVHALAKLEALKETFALRDYVADVDFDAVEFASAALDAE
jgi:hypothetical protein